MKFLIILFLLLFGIESQASRAILVDENNVVENIPTIIWTNTGGTNVFYNLDLTNMHISGTGEIHRYATDPDDIINLRCLTNEMSNAVSGISGAVPSLTGNYYVVYSTNIVVNGTGIIYRVAISDFDIVNFLTLTNQLSNTVAILNHDNLGNHNATNDLNMAFWNIKAVKNITGTNSLNMSAFGDSAGRITAGKNNMLLGYHYPTNLVAQNGRGINVELDGYGNIIIGQTLYSSNVILSTCEGNLLSLNTSGYGSTNANGRRANTLLSASDNNIGIVNSVAATNRLVTLTSTIGSFFSMVDGDNGSSAQASLFDMFSDNACLMLAYHTAGGISTMRLSKASILLHSASTTTDIARVQSVDETFGIGAVTITNSMSFTMGDNYGSEPLTIRGPRVKIGENTNCVTVNTNGSMIFNGTAKFWDDLQVPGLAVQVGPTAPDLVSTFGNIRVFGFDGNALNEEVFFSVQLPHGLDTNSLIYPHIHWMPSTTATGTVTWTLELFQQNYGANFTNGHYAQTNTMTNVFLVNSQWQHTLTNFPSYRPRKDISSIILGRLNRDSGDAADNYAADACLLGIDFHILRDQLGSYNVTSK